ncbi:hypothetical protein NUW54_g12057 [Trametes sanguinea]|uniref:Uncharacterized protein n=1 Tax=Trametes sanguinea TaxID=158606 RepID=A0ACC1N4U2_9APHY|nr:hypothetical protein NUW54_g12057 [Trametes sanguinea]
MFDQTAHDNLHDRVTFDDDEQLHTCLPVILGVQRAKTLWLHFYVNFRSSLAQGTQRPDDPASHRRDRRAALCDFAPLVRYILQNRFRMITDVDEPGRLTIILRQLILDLVQQRPPVFDHPL